MSNLSINNKVAFANTLRGLAALSVLISHYLGVFWLSRKAVISFTHAPIVSEQAHPTPWYVDLLQNLSFFDWGAFGVALFFLISGFVIPFSLFKANWKSFSVSRFFRIFPTYAVGLTFTLAAVWLAAWYFGQAFPLYFQDIVIHYFPGLHDLARAKNIDGIIWTLEIEVKFYLICALAIYLFQRQSLKVFLIPLGLGMAALCLNKQLVKLAAVGGFKFNLLSVFIFSTPYLIFMFIGVAFHYVYKKNMLTRHFIFTVLSFFILFMLTKHYSIYPLSTKHVWGYILALALFSFAFIRPTFFGGNKIINWLADISYPLYVIHGIAGYVLLTILLDMNAAPLIALFITAALVIVLAGIVHKLIELPTQQFGKKMFKQLNGETQVSFKVENKKLVLEVSDS